MELNRKGKIKIYELHWLKANIYSNNLEHLRKNKRKITEWRLVNEKETFLEKEILISVWDESAKIFIP